MLESNALNFHGAKISLAIEGVGLFLSKMLVPKQGFQV